VIAEDDPGLAEATARLLAEKYTVIVALDGLNALELVKRHQPQLLVTDIDMPGLNGIELAKQFRDAVGDQLAPIIMLSAVIDLGTRIAGLEAGAIDYVTKPFEPRELVARVDSQFRMRELAVRLQQAEQLSTLGILTSGLAHELRNPANGIVNAIGPLTELLPDELIGPDTGPGQLLEVMSECADQIRFLSKQLLGFRSGMQLEVTPVQLEEVVVRAVTLAQASINGVELRTNIVDDGRVQCSAPLLVQAVTNLIENAGHAAGRTGWVEVSTFAEAGRISIEVADSGPGVPLAMRERVFQPFFTTKAPGEGTGLGLAMARAIVQRHGGNLEIRERAGRAAFVIDLPADSFAPSKQARYDGAVLPS
jgi:signal transduction histidine kinase